MPEPIREHNKKAAAMWGSGGRAYDAISRSIADATEHCVIRLNPSPGENVADVATGTGWTSRAVARRGAKVVGIDIAEGMLSAAREIAHEQSLTIDYQLGDAEALPFPDAAFDGVISTFGVMFAPGQARAASELARVCKRGGRVAIAAWTPTSQAMTLRQALQPFMGAPPAPPPPSPFVWGTREWTSTTLGRDFQIAAEEGTAISRFSSAEEVWEVYSRGFGPVMAVVAGLDAGRRNELRNAVIEWATQLRSELGVAIPLDYLVTIGQRR
jgi:SAM-dependent methyltransferase